MIDTIVAYAVPGGIVGAVLFTAYMCDRALQRRAMRRRYQDIDISGLYARDDDRYSFKPSSDTPQLVMCGGCGHNIEPGNCPGAERCKYFSAQNSVLTVD
jgi:hypothetical protein